MKFEIIDFHAHPFITPDCNICRYKHFSDKIIATLSRLAPPKTPSGCCFEFSFSGEEARDKASRLLPRKGLRNLGKLFKSPSNNL